MVRSFLLLPLLVACSGGDDPDDGEKKRPPGGGDDPAGADSGDTDPPEDTGPPPIEPQSGTYDVTSSTVTKDTCQVPPEYTEGTTAIAWLELAVAETEITLTTPPSQSSPPATYVCPRSDLSFHCDVLDQVDSYDEYGLDAVTTITVDFDGTWTTDTHVEVQWYLGVHCTGPDCDTISDFTDIDFPCTMTSVGTLDLRTKG